MTSEEEAPFVPQPHPMQGESAAPGLQALDEAVCNVLVSQQSDIQIETSNPFRETP